jgi:diguanylate cyclase (GGDEF)-like protein/PAS domain S-box-containing protein
MGVLNLVLAGGLASMACLAIYAFIRAHRARRRERLLFEHLPQTGVVVYDRDLRVRFAAGSALRQIGWDPSEIEGKRLPELSSDPQDEALIAHQAAALRGEQRSFEYHSVRSGRDYWVRIVPVTDGNGSVVSGLSVSLDMSDRSQVDRELGSRSVDVEAVTEATRALARSVDAATARTAVCEAARQVAEAPVAALFEPSPDGGGLAPSAVVGALLSDLRLPLDGNSGAALAFSRAQEVFVSTDRGAGDADREFMRRTRAQAILWHPVIRDRAALGVLAIAWQDPIDGVSLRLSALIDLLGAEAAVAIGRADLLGRLQHMARTDDLTGLPNRRHWEEQLPRELSRALRETQSVCVAMLDLDHFKDFNDRHGHQTGDRLLRAAAAAWRQELRPYDILSRYGGEEFSVILPGCAIDDGMRLVERLRAVTPEGESCSAGLAVWDGEEQPEALVGRADAALYRAKRAGRDRAVAANPV